MIDQRPVVQFYETAMPRWLAARNDLPSSPEEGMCIEARVCGVSWCPLVTVCMVRGPLFGELGHADQKAMLFTLQSNLRCD